MLETAIKMIGITKQFPGVLANDHVDLEVFKGEILALVGENGAGKTTLMNILYGLHVQSEGEIFVEGTKVAYKSPLGAIEHGVGMVHQHFTLIPRLSIAENVVLGGEPRKGWIYDAEKAANNVKKLMDQFHITISPKTTVREISLGMQQKIEIIKSLYRGARILILDEPTAVLTLQEIEELGAIMRDLKAQGMTIIIITHKLQEVKDFSDRITVMRRGKNVGTVDTKETEIPEIIRLMVGRDLEKNIAKKQSENAQESLLEIRNLNYFNQQKQVLKDVSLSISRGEILGIAGIDGSGQDELTQIINGMIRQKSGDVLFFGKNIDRIGSMRRRKMGMGFIPQDRHKYGLVLNFSIEENLVLGFEREKSFNHAGFIDFKRRKESAKKNIKQFDIRTPDELAFAAGLSGGNQQKVIIAREMSMDPELVIANQPTRGVDIGAIEFIHGTLTKARNEGRGVLLVSLELDELMDLCDRIAVMYSGEVMGILSAAEATREKIGSMMVGKRELSGEVGVDAKRGEICGEG